MIRRIFPVIIVTLVAASASAQAPYFAPELRTNRVKSAEDARARVSPPVVIEDSTRQYFYFEIMGASEPWVPTVNGVRVWYDSTERRLKAMFPWGGTRYLDSLGAGSAPSDTALYAYFSDSARASGISDSALVAASAWAVAWTNVTGKPATFPPSSHTHVKADITDFPDSIRAAYIADTAKNVHWNNVAGKPSTFTPSAHTHPQGDVTALADTLATRSYVGHGHTVGNITGLGDSLANREWSINLPAEKAVITTLAGKLTTSTVSATEIGYLDNVTSDIQTQLDGKEPTVNLTGNRAVITSAGGGLAVSPGVTNTELEYLDGATSNIQTQIDGKQPLDADLTTLAGLIATTDNFIVSVSSAWASRTPAQAKTTLSLNNVENTALSTWAGSTNLTTLGTIGTGTWNGAIIGGVYGGTGNGFFAVSGPATSLKTFTFPNASATVLTTNAAVTVPQGGTGIASGTSGGIPYFSSSTTVASSAALTANRLVLGGGAGAAPTVVGSLGTTTQVLHGNASGAPTFGAVSLTADVSGTLPKANGGTGTTSPQDTIIKAVGFYNISAADSVYLLEVPSGAATWTVRGVRAVRTGGTAATIYVRNVTDANAVCTDYATTTSLASATLSNTSLSASDAIRVAVKSVTGTVQEIFVQVILEIPE